MSQGVQGKTGGGQGEDGLELAPTVPHIYHKLASCGEAAAIALESFQ